jgi:oxidoreductase
VANKDAYSFYSRCKAATEQGLADLGYADTIVFRPGFLRNTNRLVFRPVEAIAG